jgi:hypothetical protein
MSHFRLIAPFVCLVFGCGTQTPSLSADAPAEDSAANAFIEIGTNPQGQISTEDFELLAPDDPAQVVLGPQGAWMIVCALRTDAFAEDVDRVDVKGVLETAEGDLLGTFYYKRRPLIQGLDGQAYVMNLYLVVSSIIATWNGKNATLLLKVGIDGKDWVHTETPVFLMQVLN